MTLIDAGPMIAMINAGDHHHERCKAVLSTLQTPMVTTLPALTEALHLLRHDAGFRGEQKLLRVVNRGEIVLFPIDRTLVTRCAVLMERYKDTPMDFADATLVVAAEELRDRRIFTFDGDFKVYRFLRRQAFEIIS